MFGISIFEVLVILVIASLFLGPKQLKQLARFIARMVKGFRQLTQEITRYLEASIDENSDTKKK
ncbi:twin-arginine translocase TatA/TatE family subunit [Cysteiniphilum sp. JM-1]|uniref:Sec-independent protein translocase subunit TatA/TatB n=1 Tax=Cysteiniphilum sp. JM-1 TaxID=2610891 RepID=UPI0012465F4C|nr:twin-arginine translocase TatA/TatE family subunit [Cysteiniphilum sp. JM-1]